MSATGGRMRGSFMPLFEQDQPQAFTLSSIYSTNEVMFRDYDESAKYEVYKSLFPSHDQVGHPNLMWPTPRAKEPGRTTKGYGRGLAELVEGKNQMEPKKNWPTPTARDWKDSGKAVVNSQRNSLPQTIGS